MERELVANECQSRCVWEPTDEEIGGRQVFQCTGCRSEWTSAQAWTPRNWDGQVSQEVARARRIA